MTNSFEHTVTNSAAQRDLMKKLDMAIRQALFSMYPDINVKIMETNFAITDTLNPLSWLANYKARFQVIPRTEPRKEETPEK